MSDLTAKRRNSLPSSTFGLPGQRKYPMPDRSHAINAKARASQQESKGNITPGQKASIDAKANKVLHSGSGQHKSVGAAESHLKGVHK
jgi:hypothetical protein